MVSKIYLSTLFLYSIKTGHSASMSMVTHHPCAHLFLCKYPYRSREPCSSADLSFS